MSSSRILSRLPRSSSVRPARVLDTAEDWAETTIRRRRVRMNGWAIAGIGLAACLIVGAIYMAPDAARYLKISRM